MAEIAPDSSLAEVINSLDLTSVPEKLHCSTCQGFLLNAYKTSCCEQNVCEKCFDTVTDHCPMCKHKPFSKELCRPAKAMRNTVKAYLRTVEKSLAEERAKLPVEAAVVGQNEHTDDAEVAGAQAEANREIENGTIETNPTQSEEPAQDIDTLTRDVKPSIETGTPEAEQQNSHITPQQNDETATKRQPSVESDANDDEVEIQVEPSVEDSMLEMPQNYEAEEQEQQYDNAVMDHSKGNDTNMHDMSNGMDPNGFNNMQNMMGFSGMGMDMNMMQQMMNMNMSMNQMMGMGMGQMFGGFGGSNGNMNGMNMMGMGFNPNQMFNGWNGQNSNMWQNNNTMNAMGGDFGSPFGSNMSQQGNLYSQQFHNNDFNGYNGRYGRGRGRGGRGSYRGRGSFNNQYQPSTAYHNAHEQQQYEIQTIQAQMTQNVNGQDENVKGRTNHKEEESHDQDEFAPGGQDEVQEALGDDDREKSQTSASTPKTADIAPPKEPEQDQPEPQANVENSTAKIQSAQDSIIPEAYLQDFDSMAPPSAPTGPSGRYSDKELAFRARGHGKYSSRGRGSFSASAGFPASPIRSVSQTSISASSPSAKGVGVVGAPTGPRAMRDPSASKPPSRPTTNSGGFQIIGRASMQPQTNQPKEVDPPRSVSPTNGYDHDAGDESSSRRPSKHEKYGERNEADTDSNYDYDRIERDRERKSKRSKRTEHKDDYEMQDADQDYDSRDRKSTHRSSKYDKERSRKDEKYSSSSKHRSSRRHYDDEVESDYVRDDYGEPVEDRHRSSRSGKTSSKYESTRDRDRESHRDRKRDRDRDRDREEDKSKDKDDKHRKRSRHDRDREDEYDDPDEDESRHRSRRHKREHQSSSRKDRDRDHDLDLGLRISGRSNSNRQSALPTPTSATSSLPPASLGDTEKDPNTLEREARNRERMLKEQQRREKAAMEKRGNAAGTKSSSRTTTSGGRRVSYKYEDEVERGMGAADEREKARWR